MRERIVELRVFDFVESPEGPEPDEVQIYKSHRVLDFDIFEYSKVNDMSKEADEAVTDYIQDNCPHDEGLEEEDNMLYCPMCYKEIEDTRIAPDTYEEAYGQK